MFIAALVTIHKKKKQPTNKDLLSSTGNSTQYSVMGYMGKESKTSGYMYMYN